jgi:putative intracellular protease/amidase
VIVNGGLANVDSGQYGNPATVADDVVVDGRIITAENWDSARLFGAVIAEMVLQDADPMAKQ